VVWVFALVLDEEIFQVHEIIKECKSHDPPSGRSYTAFSRGQPQAIAYTDLLGAVVIIDVIFLSNYSPDDMDK
jgi:hypothetical protein